MANIDIEAPGADEADLRDALQDVLGNWRVLAASGASVAHTGNTDETALATVTIPAGALGANGVLRVSALFSFTNNANNKTPRFRLGGLAGTAIWGVAQASVATAAVQRTIQNRNSQASQVTWVAATINSFFSSTGAVSTASINTANATDLVISGQLATGTDTITLESYLVELLHAA